jgi:cobalt-zinc-cadmium efflux system outer membrane protein
VLENLGFPIPFSATQAKAAGFEVLPHPVPSVNHIHGGRGCTLRKIGGALALVVAILAGTPALARTLTLTEAETTALAHNAELAGVESQLAQAKARLGGASLLLQENPELVAGAGQRSGGLNSSLDLELGVQQRFELFGQRGARIDTAQASVNAAQASLDAERLNLLAKIRSAFGRLLARQRAATVAEESLRLGGDALGAARARLSAGESNRRSSTPRSWNAGRRCAPSPAHAPSWRKPPRS